MNRPDEPIPGKPKKDHPLSPIGLFIFQEAKRIHEEYVRDRKEIFEASDSKFHEIMKGLDAISKRLSPEEESYKKLISDADSIEDSNPIF